MGNKNGTIGLIDKKPGPTFIWSLLGIRKLVDDGDQCWRDSPSFSYKDKTWCLQVQPRLDANPYVAFRLRLTSEAEKMDINYRLSISIDKKIIVWQSPTICDTFGEKEDLGMLISHKKSFIEDVIARTSDYISLHVLFGKVLISPGIVSLRASMSSVTPADENVVDGEVVEKPLKEKIPQKDKKKESLEEFNKLSFAFNDLFRSGDGSDVTVKVGEKTFPAHKTVLMARSPVFRRMLQHDMAESRDGIIQIRDSNPDSVKKLLSYLYSGILPDLSEREVVALHPLADMYNLPSLVEHCRHCMLNMLNVDNFCELFTVGSKYADLKFVRFCKDFFKENIKSIVKTEKWRRFLTENPLVASDLIAESL